MMAWKRAFARTLAGCAAASFLLVSAGCSKDEATEEEVPPATAEQKEAKTPPPPGLDAALKRAEAKRAEAPESMDFTEPGDGDASPGKQRPSRKGAKNKTSPRTRKARTGAALNVQPMLDKKDIRESTGYTGLLQRDEIVGQMTGKQYNATRWKAETKTGLGFGLEVWKPGSAGSASKRYDELYKQSMGGERSKDVGDQSFRAEHHAVRSIVFLDRRRSTVASVICESTLCDFEQLTALARRVQRRL